MTIAQLRRNYQISHFPADGFVPGVTERFFRGGIEVQNATLVVDRDDAIQRGLENGRLQRLADTQRGFRASDKLGGRRLRHWRMLLRSVVGASRKATRDLLLW